MTKGSSVQSRNKAITRIILLIAILAPLYIVVDFVIIPNLPQSLQSYFTVGIRTLTVVIAMVGTIITFISYITDKGDTQTYIDQQGQTVQGNQYNTAGNLSIHNYITNPADLPPLFTNVLQCPITS